MKIAKQLKYVEPLIKYDLLFSADHCFLDEEYRIKRMCIKINPKSHYWHDWKAKRKWEKTMKSLKLQPYDIDNLKKVHSFHH